LLDIQDTKAIVLARDSESGRYFIANGEADTKCFRVSENGSIRADILLPSKLRAAYNLDNKSLHRLHIDPIPVATQGRNWHELVKRD
jgi:hypothetical protein